jgi:hypothetical protein
MVEHPGMWDEARSLFQVGTVAGVQRKWPKPVWCGVSTRFGNAWVSGFDYRKGANNQTRAKDRSLRQLLHLGTFGDIWGHLEHLERIPM